jgi:hypothetical protein
MMDLKIHYSLQEIFHSKLKAKMYQMDCLGEQQEELRVDKNQ